MQETIAFDVPETTTSRFVIATDYPPTDPKALVPWQVIRPFAREAAERVGTPALVITSRPASDSSIDLSGLTANVTEDESSLGAASHLVEVAATVPVSGQPRGFQIARAVARAIAGFTRGVLADLTTGCVLIRDDPGRPGEPFGREEERFRLADEWVADDLPRNECRCGTPVPTAQNLDACRRVRLSTRGLSRFGLPELRMDEISCEHDLAALNLLRSVASRLLTDHWAWLATGPVDRHRIIPRRLTLDGQDYGRFWNCECDCGDSTVVRLTGIRADLIEVGPPAEFRASTNEWLWAVTPPWAFTGSGCEDTEIELVAAEPCLESLPELSYEEKGRVLDELLILAPDLTATADGLAGGWLSTAGRYSVLEDVQTALAETADDLANGRPLSPSHRPGDRPGSRPGDRAGSRVDDVRNVRGASRADDVREVRIARSETSAEQPAQQQPGQPPQQTSGQPAEQPPGQPSEETASWLLGWALRPFYADLRRRVRLGRAEAATELAVGMLRALHHGRDQPAAGPFAQAPDLADEQIGALLRLCGRLPVSLPVDELDRYPPSRRHGIRRAD